MIQGQPNVSGTMIPAKPEDVIAWFGQLLLKQFAPEKQYTVAEWIDYVIDIKAANDRKNKTISDYRFCSKRIKQEIGDMLLTDVRPTDISELFVRLRKEKAKVQTKAKMKSDLMWYLTAQNLSKTRLAAKASISESTLDRAIKGYKVLLPKAEAIANALGYETEELFEIIQEEKELSRETIQDYRRFLAMVFGVAERELLIMYNPVTRAELPMPPKHKTPRTLQLDDVQAVLTAAAREPINKQALIHMFLITGCRRGEIAGLRWSDISWDEKLIFVNHEVLCAPEYGVYSQDDTKTGKGRMLRLPEVTVQLLSEYREWQDRYKMQLGEQWLESDYIFTAKHGGPINPDTISTYIARFQERYHLPPIHPHKFRHTMASILIYAGMDIVTVAKRLGHAQVSTTVNMYADLILKADMESADCIADAIFHGEKLK